MTSRIATYLRNNVLGLIAIFIALGTGAYAAGLPKNSVKSKQIKDGAVNTAELADGAVTAPKVANGSLLGEDFAAGQLPAGPEGDQGPKGETGGIGATGPQGPVGPRGAAIVARARGNTTVVTPHSPAFQNYPLTTASWVQAAGSVDEMVAEFSYTPPPGTCGGNNLVAFLVEVNGQDFAFPAGTATAGGGPTTFKLRLGGLLFEPATDTPRVMTLSVADDCPGAGDHATVTGAKIDVIESL